MKKQFEICTVHNNTILKLLAATLKLILLQKRFCRRS